MWLVIQIICSVISTLIPVVWGVLCWFYVKRQKFELAFMFITVVIFLTGIMKMLSCGLWLIWGN